MIKNLEIILTGIVLFALILMLVFIPIDIIDFYSDKETFANVYHLNMNEKNWEFNYLIRWLYPGVTIVIGLIIIAMRLIKQNSKLIQRINWIFLGFMFIQFIVNLLNWMISGSDH